MLGEAHRAIVAAGIEIDGVSVDGRIDFKGTPTKEQRDLARSILLSKLAMTKADALAEIKERRDELIDQLLLRTFYPDVKEDKKDGSTLDRRV